MAVCGYASGDTRAETAMARMTLGDLYSDHLREVMGRADRALAAFGYDGLIVGSGSQRYFYLDDNTYPFSSARNPGEPDPNEFIIIRLDRPIRFFARAQDR